MTYTPRPLLKGTLTGYAEYMVDEFKKPSVYSPERGRFLSGRSFAMEQLHKVGLKDEFEYIVAQMDARLENTNQVDEWETAKRKWFEPRRQDVFEDWLERHYAVRPDGTHIEGRIGKVQFGNRVVGRSLRYYRRYFNVERGRVITFVDTTPQPPAVGFAEKAGFRKPGTHRGIFIDEIVKMRSDYWPVYAGELVERKANPEGAAHLDDLPEGHQDFVEEFLATSPKMSNVAAIAACNAVVDLFESLGTTAGTINGRDGSKPADVDATETGTLLFTLTLNLNDAFGTAIDDTGKATATANTITADTAANASGTLSYCRCASTGTGADDILDGEAGTSASDFNFNTLSIILNTNVSMSAFTVSISE